MQTLPIPVVRARPVVQILLVLGPAILGLGLAGCAPEAEPPAERPAEDTGEDLEQTGEGLEETGRRVGEELEEAGEALERGAERAGDELEPAARDARITAAVKSRLLSDPEVSAFQIDVDTVDGSVTLNGVVDSERAKEEAEELARNTEGVTEVQNLLQVEPEEG